MNPFCFHKLGNRFLVATIAVDTLLFTQIYKILVTCCILSKSKQGRWGRCIRWFVCLICRRLGDTEQWNNFAGGLIDCTSIEIFGLSQESLIFSRPRPQSLSISGVFERYIIVLRCGFSASIGGDVRKFTTGAGIFSRKLRTCTTINDQKKKRNWFWLIFMKQSMPFNRITYLVVWTLSYWTLSTLCCDAERCRWRWRFEWINFQQTVRQFIHPTVYIWPVDHFELLLRTVLIVHQIIWWGDHV